MYPQGSLLCSQGSDPIFLFLSAWWLPGLPDSQDGGTHFSDKPPLSLLTRITEFSSVSHSKSTSFQGDSLPCLCHIGPSKGSEETSRALEGYLVGKDFP